MTPGDGRMAAAESSRCGDERPADPWALDSAVSEVLDASENELIKAGGGREGGGRRVGRSSPGGACLNKHRPNERSEAQVRFPADAAESRSESISVIERPSHKSEPTIGRMRPPPFAALFDDRSADQVEINASRRCWFIATCKLFISHPLTISR